MNIFYLSKSPRECAEWAVDKHVIKMILEAAQLLSTAHRVLDGYQVTTKVTGRNRKEWNLRDPELDSKLYKATHVNHPCAIWDRQSSTNYLWLWDYLYEHCREYTHRYGKVHKVEREGLLDLLKSNPKNIPFIGFTDPPCAMDKQYIISADPIENYRNYYKHGKSHLHSWKNREPPDWIH